MSGVPVYIGRWQDHSRGQILTQNSVQYLSPVSDPSARPRRDLSEVFNKHVVRDLAVLLQTLRGRNALSRHETVDPVCVPRSEES
jgi:hypothetical protein